MSNRGVNMKYYIMLFFVVVNLFSTFYIINTSSDIPNKLEPDSEIESQSVISLFTAEKSISELETMYKEIEQRKIQIQQEPEEILGNDNHIIMIGYYQSQIMILNEIKNQTGR